MLAVAFMQRDPDDWLSRMCYWWISRQSANDKNFECSHCSLILNDHVYEWRVGGLDVETFQDWIRRDGNAIRLRHWVHIDISDVELFRVYDRLQTLHYTSGPSYLDFWRYSRGRAAPNVMLCTGFIRLLLGMEVRNTTPLLLYRELRCRKSDAPSVQVTEETQQETT